MSKDAHCAADPWMADHYLELGALAELEWQGGRAANAARKAERAGRKLSSLRNWGPLRFLPATDEGGSTRG